MKRITGWFLLHAIFLGVYSSIDAQQPTKVPRIGYLTTFAFSSRAFRQGLRELTYLDGENIVVEYRSAQGEPDRLAGLAAELVKLKVAVIVAGDTVAIGPAAKSTRTIPIVMVSSGDPIAAGYVTSLARPGGNITGLSNLAPDLAGKRLELLKEAAPKLSRVIVLGQKQGSYDAQLQEIQNTARGLRLEIEPISLGSIDADLARVFSSRVIGSRAAGLVVLPSPRTNARSVEIVHLAAKIRLPAIYPLRRYVEDGGLLSYGPDIPGMQRRAAVYVDKILKGAEPADIPVEQPKKFELVINLQTAKQIGLTVPPHVLARADRVIR